MAHRRVEAEVEALEQLCASAGAEAAAALKKGLADKVSLVAAKAAKLTASLQLRELIPDLIRAFDRLLEDGAARDPQCWGKNAIARALTELEHRESAVYLRGARHVQLEAVWGGREDTAGPLRGICLLGLAAATDLSRAETFRALVDGLGDSAHTVRLEAVRAVTQMEGEEAALLLRLKARAGDREPRVIGQVFDCLVGLEGQVAFRFLAGFLEPGAGPVCEEAALALGASRHPAALSLLQEAWKGGARSRSALSAAALDQRVPAGGGPRISDRDCVQRAGARCSGCDGGALAAPGFRGTAATGGSGGGGGRVAREGAVPALLRQNLTASGGWRAAAARGTMEIC